MSTLNALSALHSYNEINAFRVEIAPQVPEIFPVWTPLNCQLIGHLLAKIGPSGGGVETYLDQVDVC